MRNHISKLNRFYSIFVEMNELINQVFLEWLTCHSKLLLKMSQFLEGGGGRIFSLLSQFFMSQLPQGGGVSSNFINVLKFTVFSFWFFIHFWGVFFFPMSISKILLFQLKMPLGQPSKKRIYKDIELN